MESSEATVTNGMVTVKLRCNLPAACRGAVLICLPRHICSFGETRAATIGGRLAGADFVVPPGKTNEVGIALNTLGQQVTSGPGGFAAVQLVDLLNYGVVATPELHLTSTDPPTYPAGATASCGGTVFAGPDTSCPFAENVERAYKNAINFTDATDIAVSATSPVTGKAYEMKCAGVSPVTCRGGTDALVKFY